MLARFYAITRARGAPKVVQRQCQPGDALNQSLHAANPSSEVEGSFFITFQRLRLIRAAPAKTLIIARVRSTALHPIIDTLIQGCVIQDDAKRWVCFFVRACTGISLEFIACGIAKIVWSLYNSVSTREASSIYSRRGLTLFTANRWLLRGEN